MPGKNLVQKARYEYLISVKLDPTLLGAWGIKYRNFVSNSSLRGRICDINFQEYIGLAIMAGITDPDQIGTGIDKYHMCRKGDQGDYEIGNCEFKPHRQNAIEKIENGGTRSQAEKTSRSFLITSPEGVRYEGSNLRQFCVIQKLGHGNMSLVCRGIKSAHKGWKGHYTDGDTI